MPRILLLILTAVIGSAAISGCVASSDTTDGGAMTSEDAAGITDTGPADTGASTRPCTIDKDCPEGLECRTHLCVPPVVDGGPSLDAGPIDGGSLDSGPVSPDGGCYGPQKLEVSPASVGFGVVTAGCTSKDVQVTLKNTGCHDLPIYLIGIVPTTNSMLIASAPPTPFSITGGSDLTIDLRYHPQSSNGSETATLQVQWDDGTRQALTEVPLQGAGVSSSDTKDVFRQSAAPLITVFYLGRWPDPKTIVVTVRNTEIKEGGDTGWTYDANANAVVFGVDAVPPVASTITVSYTAACY